MSQTSYAVPAKPFLWLHQPMTAVWLGDYDEPDTHELNHADALAASGDYFITLATRLDKIAQGLQQDSAEQIELEYIVTTLFYLQDHWQLSWRSKRSP